MVASLLDRSRHPSTECWRSPNYRKPHFSQMSRSPCWHRRRTDSSEGRKRLSPERSWCNARRFRWLPLTSHSNSCRTLEGYIKKLRSGHHKTVCVCGGACVCVCERAYVRASVRARVCAWVWNQQWSKSSRHQIILSLYAHIIYALPSAVSASVHSRGSGSFVVSQL